MYIDLSWFTETDEVTNNKDYKITSVVEKKLFSLDHEQFKLIMAKCH